MSTSNLSYNDKKESIRNTIKTLQEILSTMDDDADNSSSSPSSSTPNVEATSSSSSLFAPQVVSPWLYDSPNKYKGIAYLVEMYLQPGAWRDDECKKERLWAMIELLHLPKELRSCILYRLDDYHIAIMRAMVKLEADKTFRTMYKERHYFGAKRQRVEEDPEVSE